MTLKINRSFVRWFLVSLLFATIDLVSKHLIANYLRTIANQMQIYDPKIQILAFFDIVYVWNRGVSFGFLNKLENSHLILSLLQGSIAMIVVFMLYRSKQTVTNLAYALILGGAVGNVVDRIINGAVFDFLDFHIALYHWPAFNLADSFIFVGVAILIYREFFMKNN